MSKSRKLAKNTIIIGVGQLIPRVLAVVTLPILTTAFTTSEFGTYDLIISFTSLALPLMTLLIQQSVFRYLIDDDSPESRKKYITNATYVILLSSLIYLTIAIIIGISFKLNMLLLISAFLLYFFDCIYDFLGQISRGINKNVWYSSASAVYSIVNVAFLATAFCFKFLDINIALIVVGLSYSMASIFLMVRIKIFKYIDFRLVSKRTIRGMLKYSIPVIPSSISLWVANLSDRLIVTTFISSAANGIYAAACKLPNIYATIFNIFNLAWTEHAARYLKDKDSVEHYSNLLNALVSFMVGAMLLLMACSRWLFEVLIDSKFSDGYVQLPILYAGVLVSCLVSFYGGLYVAFKKTKKVGISSFVGAIINIIINFAFVKEFGIYAASFSTLISFVAILIYRVIDVRKYIKISYSYRNIAISFVFLVISIVLFYASSNFAVILANIVLAFLYNLFFNELIKKILKRRRV